MVEILTIGDELLSGATADSNACSISGLLSAAGMSISRITSVGDDCRAIERALLGALPETQFVIATGGLGPTEDDKTAQAAAAAFARPLVLNEEAFSLMAARLKEWGRPLREAHKKQAMLPEGAAVLENPVGTACGFMVMHEKRRYFFVPGVPEEVRALTREHIIPAIMRATGQRLAMTDATLKVFGLWESEIHERLNGFLPPADTVSVGYYPQFPEIRIRLTARGSDPGGLKKKLDAVKSVIYERIGEYIYTDSDRDAAGVVGDLLQERSATLAVAESCTGGLIAHCITRNAGSSHYFDRCLVTYTNRAKRELLGVAEAPLKQHGAVSEPVARQMARGARTRAGATYGLGVTGIAGPSGGTDGKPVGTVFVCIDWQDGAVVRRYLFSGNRQQVQMMSAHAALHLLREVLLGRVTAA